MERWSGDSKLAFARPALSVASMQVCSEVARGLPNLGNTCYINAIVQCLFHCTPFRKDIELHASGVSFLGDCLKNLWCCYRRMDATHADVLLRLGELVSQILHQSDFLGGTQQDAAECLVDVLKYVDEGRMQQRVSGAHAVASLESMIHIQTTAEMQVSSEAPTVCMASLIQKSLTGEQSILQATSALVFRVENVYEQGDQHFVVDARADWSQQDVEITVSGRDGF